MTRQVKKLKAFEKVMITAGESITIDFNLTEADLSYYDNRGLLVFEPGAFSVFVGGSSQTALEQKVEVE